MPRPLNDISADFDALVEHDFDLFNEDADGAERLECLCDEMRAINDPARCIPVMLRTMERLDCVELGTPGPLVHTIENWAAEYHTYLAESIRRKPSPLTVWMVNRILNSKPQDRGNWIGLLGSVANHPTASETTKADALDFLNYQSEP